MKLAKLSVSYEYLYSPKNWLHYQNSEIKLILMLINLACLPFVSTKTIFGCLISLMLAQKSIKMPQNLKNYFNKSMAVFSFFILLSVKCKNNLSNFTELYERNIVQIHQGGVITRKYIASSEDERRFSLCLPISIVRFTGIHLIYLFLIRFVLLTTKYEYIARIIAYNCRHLRKKLIFIIMTSLQFLKTIFQEIEITQTAYILRNMNIGISRKRVFVSILTSFLSQLLINIRIVGYDIAYTLYSKDVKYSNLIHKFNHSKRKF